MFFYYTERNLIFILKEIQLKVLKYDGTHLTGRHLSMELSPFSYSEFIRFKELENGENAVLGYLKTGGIPEYLKTGISVSIR